MSCLILVLAVVVFLLRHRILEFRKKHRILLKELIERGKAVFVTMQIILVLNVSHKNVGGASVAGD